MAEADYSTEEWRDIPGWEGWYQISSLGRVKSVARGRGRRCGRILKAPLNEGYPRVGLKAAGRHEHRYAHELVCEAWHGPRPNGYDVAHADGSRTNNRPENLRWATRKENMWEKVEHGRQHRGEQTPSSKLTEPDVRLIRQLDMRQREIAAMFRIDQSQVSEIRARKAWAHVGD